MDSLPKYFFLCLLVFSTFSCEQLTEEEIAGSWKLLEVSDEGDSVAVDLSVACLDLGIDQTFNYKLTEQENMKGTYHLDNDILNLWCQNPDDTIKVQILEITDAQMTLRMNHNGTERKIGLAKLPVRNNSQ